MNDSLARILEFTEELEKLKTVTRRNRTLDEDRFENSAEHSWHTGMMALTMKEYLPPETDITRVILMLLIHDIVEIDTGDVYLYDDEKRREIKNNEGMAAERLFGLLPEPQASEYLDLWREFEKRETADARSAAALDTLQPLINHNVTGRENLHGMTVTRVAEKKLIIKEVSPELWELAQHLISSGVKKGLFLNS